MNGTTFQVINPLSEVVNQAQQIMGQLEVASDELASCIADERYWFAAYREVLDTYEMVESEIVSEAVINAQLKEGPLAGIPVSGKGYDIVLTKIKNDARNGALFQQWAAVVNAKRSYDAFKVDLDKSEARMKSLLRMAELMNGIIRASTI